MNAAHSLDAVTRNAPTIIEFDNGVRTTRMREVRLIRGGPTAVPH